MVRCVLVGVMGAFLGGCVGSFSPAAFGPVGGPGGQPVAASGKSPIDLTVEGRVARTVVTPQIIDTRDFAQQVALSAPFAGQVRDIENQLEDEEAEEALEVPRGPRNGLTPGGLTSVSRVAPGAFFPGITQTPWSPPDPSIAVGPDHIVETVNTAIAFFTKDGTMVFSQNLDSSGNPGFFETAGAGSFTFDPKCYYDPHSGRFVVLALEVYDNIDEAWIDIAVSDDSDPNGVWYKYRTWAVIQINSSTYWVDYPGFGYDSNAFYSTGNLFKLAGGGGGFGGALYRIFEKAPMLAGEPVEFTDFRDGGSGSVQVAQAYGSADRTFFVSRASSSVLRIQTVNDPLGDPTMSEVGVSVPSASGPDQGAPNLGGGVIDTLDGRIMNVHWRNGKLYAAHGIDSGPLTVSRWYEIDTHGWPNGANPSLSQSGNIAPGAGIHTFFPAIASDQFGNVAMVNAQSSSSAFASVVVTARKPGDQTGTMSAPEEVAIGSATANGRWGDYFDMTLDPVDDRTFWLVGERQKSFGWETWIGTFTVACPGDFNQDGELDVIDFVTFQIVFENGDLLADCDGNGVLNVLDFVCFQQAFALGCGG